MSRPHATFLHSCATLTRVGRVKATAHDPRITLIRRRGVGPLGDAPACRTPRRAKHVRGTVRGRARTRGRRQPASVFSAASTGSVSGQLRMVGRRRESDAAGQIRVCARVAAAAVS